MSKNQYTLLATFNIQGFQPKYMGTFLFIYSFRFFDKIQFFKDFVTHVLLTDSVYIDLGLFHKMHFQNVLNQDELDDARDDIENRFLTFLEKIK